MYAFSDHQCRKNIKTCWHGSYFFLYFKCQRPLNPYEPPQKTLKKKFREKNVYCNDFTILNFHKKVRRHTYSPQKISRKRLLNCQMIRVTPSQVTTLLKMNDIRYKVWNTPTASMHDTSEHHIVISDILYKAKVNAWCWKQ